MLHFRTGSADTDIDRTNRYLWSRPTSEPSSTNATKGGAIGKIVDPKDLSEIESLHQPRSSRERGSRISTRAWDGSAVNASATEIYTLGKVCLAKTVCLPP